MPTFIDESGDTGHEVHSSLHFRLAAVWVPTQPQAEALRADLEQFRRARQLPQKWEFKFSMTGSSQPLITAFYATILHHEFRFAVASVNKRSDAWSGAMTKDIYAACALSLAKTLHPKYLAEEATGRRLREQFVVDDNRDKRFLAAIKNAFGGLPSFSRPKEKLVRSVRFQRSHSTPLLQVADMACGATAAYLDGHGEWYKLIQSRCLSVDQL